MNFFSLEKPLSLSAFEAGIDIESHQPH